MRDSRRKKNQKDKKKEKVNYLKIAVILFMTLFVAGSIGAYMIKPGSYSPNDDENPQDEDEAGNILISMFVSSASWEYTQLEGKLLSVTTLLANSGSINVTTQLSHFDMVCTREMVHQAYKMEGSNMLPSNGSLGVKVFFQVPDECTPDIMTFDYQYPKLEAEIPIL